MSKITLEICIDTPAALIAAQKGGADRVELCSALVAGGLTPNRGFMRFAAAQKMCAHVMIRPREGDFCFDQHEMQLMLDDIALAQNENMQGVVLGATQQDGQLDMAMLNELVSAANGMDITLHRAFDVTPDPFEALEQAIELGFNRILTSGQKTNASAGIELIAQLVERAAGRIEIMPGSGVGLANAKELLAINGITSLHSSCSAPLAQSPKAAQDLGFSAKDGRRETVQNRVEELVQTLANLEGAAS